MPTRLVKKLVCYGLLISNHNGARVFLKSPLNLNNTVRYFIYSKFNQSKAEKYREIFGARTQMQLQNDFVPFVQTIGSTYI